MQVLKKLFRRLGDPRKNADCDKRLSNFTTMYASNSLKENGEKCPDLSNSGNKESVRPKAKETIHKHYAPGDMVVSQGYRG